MSVTLHPRSEWGVYVVIGKDKAMAPPQPSENPSWNPEAGVFIHYRGGGNEVLPTEEDCKKDIASVFNEHNNSEFEYDIAYNFLICPHGNIYIGRGYERGEANYGDGEAPEQKYGRNANFYSICGLLRDNIASEAMVRSFRQLIDHLRREAPRRITKGYILPHKYKYDTLCPGSLTMYAQPGSSIDPAAPWTGTADIQIYAAQQWCNSTYTNAAAYERCPEFGKTGWSTVLSMTQGLQWELGISPTVRNFGPGTFNAVKARGKVPSAETNSNLIHLYNGTMWSKGYFASTDQGSWNHDAQVSLTQLYGDTGLDFDSMVVSMWPHVCRALFRMDQFKQIPQGNAITRKVQQWLNRRYVASIGIPAMILVPCDGWYSRDVAQGFMMALQYELGIALSSINGNFGPTTQSLLKSKGTRPLSSDLRYIFRSACFFNSPIPDGAGHLAYSPSDMDTDTETSTHVAWIKAFQRFSQLPVTGTNEYATWAQLLVSTGDADRPATGCDCITQITASRGAQLKDAGYKIVGRYLDEDVDPSDPRYLGKALKPGEPQAILDAGLRFFPIFQYSGRSLSSFTYDTGSFHGGKAHDKAVSYRVPAGTCIYFAVDYDALDEDIDSNIKPYFQGVFDSLRAKGERYVYGVYGSRNVCTRISQEQGATWSFVSGMSWGFSGNLGFTLPENWAFNQIKEFSFGGSGGFGLDNDVWRADGDPGVQRLEG